MDTAISGMVQRAHVYIYGEAGGGDHVLKDQN